MTGLLLHLKGEGHQQGCRPLARALMLHFKVFQGISFARVGVATLRCHGTAGLQLPGSESALPAPGRGTLLVPLGRGMDHQTAPFSS